MSYRTDAARNDRSAVRSILERCQQNLVTVQDVEDAFCYLLETARREENWFATHHPHGEEASHSGSEGA